MNRYEPGTESTPSPTSSAPERGGIRTHVPELPDHPDSAGGRAGSSPVRSASAVERRTVNSGAADGDCGGTILSRKRVGGWCWRSWQVTQLCSSILTRAAPLLERLLGDGLPKAMRRETWHSGGRRLIQQGRIRRRSRDPPSCDGWLTSSPRE